MKRSVYFKNVDFIFGDVRNKSLLKKEIDRNDIIVWLAAIVGDGACAVNPKLTESINEKSVKWLVDNYGSTKKIIFMSTCSVYGVNNGLLDENTEPYPVSDYARTKLNAEQYIVDNAKKYLIFRLTVYFKS